MNLKDKKKIQEVVQKEISKTMSSISEYKILTQPISPENAIGRVSRMDAINNKSVTELALRQAEKKLENLRIVEKEIAKSFDSFAKQNWWTPAGILNPLQH